MPEGSQIYAAEPRPDGVVGGPGGEKLEADVLEVLRARGEKPTADGALAGTACWALHEINEGRRVDLVAGDLACHKFGFGGVLVTLAVFGMNTPDVWHEIDLGRLGIGARVHEDNKGKRLSVVLVLDGPACRAH